MTIASAGTTVWIANLLPGAPTAGATYDVLITLYANYGGSTVPPGTIDYQENGVTKCTFDTSAMILNEYTCSGLLAATQGTRSLTATFTPSTSDYLGATHTRPLSVLGTPSTAAITSVSPSSPTAGSSYNVTVQVNSLYAALPGGTVTLSDGSGGSQGSCGSWSPGTSNVSHTITCGFTSSMTGGKTLTATFSGNSALAASIAKTALTVAKGATTVTIGTLAGPNSGAPSVLVLNRPFTVPVTVSGGTGSVLITYSAGGSCTATLTEIGRAHV